MVSSNCLPQWVHYKRINNLLLCLRDEICQAQNWEPISRGLPRSQEANEKGEVFSDEHLIVRSAPSRHRCHGIEQLAWSGKALLNNSHMFDNNKNMLYNTWLLCLYSVREDVLVFLQQKKSLDQFKASEEFAKAYISLLHAAVYDLLDFIFVRMENY